MKIGFVGLGRMGFNMISRLMENGHQVVAFDVHPEVVAKATAVGAQGVRSVEEMTSRLPSPRIVWVMVPSGEITGKVINEVAAKLGPGDIIIDGGNSNFHDTVTRGKELEQRGIVLLDSGTSGGVWGLKNGYCLMIGGEEKSYQICEPLFKTLAPAKGYLRVGPGGSGHYVKMVHNGIEYGMMQAYAEGFEILNASDYDLDLAAIAGLWNQGSVVRSWLLELAEASFKEDPKLAHIRGYVADSGEGRWTVIEAMDKDVPAVALTYALMNRFRSRQEDTFAGKVLAALRNQFGGHAVKEREA